MVIKKCNERMKISRVAVREVEVWEAKLRKSLSLVFNTFLRGPVGTRGFMGGEHTGGSVLCTPSIDSLVIDARKYFFLQLCSSGPTASRAIDARDNMSRVWRSRGHIGTPR